MTDDFIPRPGQAEVLKYTGGRMGVSAVPGSGKTETLSRLAEKLVAAQVADAEEVLVVTLVNSAVDNFAGRLARLVTARGLLPNFGYRVRTLHGLAHDIVRDRPELVQLAEDFQIVDQSESERILREAADAWVRGHADVSDAFLAPDLEGRWYDKVTRDYWPELVAGIAQNFIKRAKDLLLTPEDIAERLEARAQALPLAEMGRAIYADYQRALRYRGAVDFDDLIALALKALELDGDLCARLGRDWPYVLEDEAQDSSRLQEEILKKLTRESGNWVRVGDPNQAIYETFTTANPQYLRDFRARPGTRAVDLPHSGRSTLSIIRLANYLIGWEHPVEAVRAHRPLTPPYIEPVPAGQPHGNPPDAPDKIYMHAKACTPDEEVQLIINSLAKWLPEHPGATVAVLAPRHERGRRVVEALQARALPYVEMLRTTSATREAAGVLGNVIRYLADPTAPNKLATLYQAWRRADRKDPAARPRLESITKALRGCPRVEDFLWPQMHQDWEGALDLDADDREALRDHLDEFRARVRRWQAATLLPIDQLVLIVAQDLFDAAADLALAHSMAVFLRRQADAHPHWQLPELAEELAVIARNERRFRGFAEEETGFSPDEHKGEVVVSTMHGAKGLEWDRVYLMSVNNYDFPSGQAHDVYIGERWFVRGSDEIEHLDLQTEALAQLEALAGGAQYEEGAATRAARLEYVAERLRLFYVGITRARKELIITWNTGRRGDCQPSAPFIELQTRLDAILKADLS
ncbi:MAG: ATP-dependent helicase [Anaerolineae bacterium]|nr:ATP-dependent helicase [Anaerolineae bacterium]